MKLDARRAFIKSSKGKLGGIVINTPAENLLPETYQKRSIPERYAMWMQKGMEVERYRKESIANPNSIPAANNFALGRKSDTELCSNFKRVIGNTAISLQPMLGTWIILITIDLI
jgi:hypothetical protein